MIDRGTFDTFALLWERARCIAVVPLHRRYPVAHALRLEPEQAAKSVANDFLSALTELSRAYGIAIGDGAQLFVMEAGDEAFGYSADDESRLIRA